MCLFCEIAAGGADAETVYRDDHTIAFLDIRPLQPGHLLLIPRRHYATLVDLPADEIGPLFSVAQRLAAAVEAAMDAQGTFVAINNKVSQSVPHLHVHVVPRKPKDGLKGFFWPRRKYGDGEAAAVAELIRNALVRA